MPLFSTRVLVFVGVVFGLIVLGVTIVKPALERPRAEGPTLGSTGQMRPAFPTTLAAPESPSPPVPARPSKQPRMPTNAAEVVPTFPQALAAVRARLGAGAQLTSVNVNEISVLWAYRVGRGNRAGVLRWRPERAALEEADPRFAAPGDLREKLFPISAVRPLAPARLIAGVRRLAPREHVVHTVHLFRLPVSRALIWQLTVEAEGRYLTYRAAPDGSGLRELR